MDMLILAGGFGSRLKNAVSDVPKPLAPINGLSLLQLQLAHWMQQGQKNFTFLLYHEAEKIIEVLVSLNQYYGSAISIDWVVEEMPLGTGGSVANALRNRTLSDSIIISNADTWLEEGLQKISNVQSAALATVKVCDTARYGSICLDRNGYVTDFLEKHSTPGIVSSGIINAGLYKLPADIFLDVGKMVFSIEAEILPVLSGNKLLKALMLNSDFFDIGIPEDYYKFCIWHKGKYGDL
jgi:D-glycero-alpha-D-manno-heptose 1-phosphate guanylyltransferase